MAGLTGKSTTGMGQDIVNFLTEVAQIFEIELYVTSGLRTADAQAKAMWDNWLKLKRGAVYKTSSLPVADREALDGYYKTAREDPKATFAARTTAQAEFLKLAKERLGAKSQHSRGRAIDVRVAGITAKVYKAITLKMNEVKEGREDIYHFEAVTSIPSVDQALRDQITAIKDAAPAATPPVRPKQAFQLFGLPQDVHIC